MFVFSHFMWNLTWNFCLNLLQHLDKCFRKKHKRKAAAVAWDSLGTVGQLSIFLLAFMSSTLAISIFLARAKRRRQDGESYLGFIIRDIQGRKRKKRKKLRKRVGSGTLDEDLLSDEDEVNIRTVPARPGKSSKKSDNTRSSRSRSSGVRRTRSKSKERNALTLERIEEEENSKAPSRSKLRTKSRSRSKSVKRNPAGASEGSGNKTPRRQLV